MAAKPIPQKRKAKNKRKNRVMSLCAVLCLALLLTFGERWFAVIKVSAAIRNAEARLCEVNTERLELEEELALLKDKEYLASLAREKLGYILPGEELWLEAEVNPEVLEKAEESDEIIAD